MHQCKDATTRCGNAAAGSEVGRIRCDVTIADSCYGCEGEVDTHDVPGRPAKTFAACCAVIRSNSVSDGAIPVESSLARCLESSRLDDLM